MNELKPCPHCKTILEIEHDLNYWWVNCPKCYYESEMLETEEQAIEFANTRPVEDVLTAENAELKEECRQSRTLKQDMQSLKDCYREKDKECEALKAKVAELGELLNKQLQYNDFMTSNIINALKFENARMREMVRRIDDDAEEAIIDSYKRTEKQAHNDLRRFAKAIRQRCEHALKGGEA